MLFILYHAQAHLQNWKFVANFKTLSLL